MFVSALKQNQLVFDGKWIPQPAEWHNFSDAWNAAPFGMYFRNTLVIAVGAVTGAATVAPRWCRRKACDIAAAVTEALTGCELHQPLESVSGRAGFERLARDGQGRLEVRC